MEENKSISFYNLSACIFYLRDLEEYKLAYPFIQKENPFIHFTYFVAKLFSQSLSKLQTK